MKSFYSFLMEEIGAVPGNYVCSYTLEPIVPKRLLPKSGKVPEGNYHITLMYSPNSNVDQRTISNSLLQVPRNFELAYDYFDCFDSIPKEDNQRAEDKATLVLKVKSLDAEHIHLAMKSLGMEHTYPEFSPHVTIAYDVDRNEAYNAKDKLNQWLLTQPQMTILTTYLKSTPIDKEWVKKL